MNDVRPRAIGIRALLALVALAVIGVVLGLVALSVRNVPVAHAATITVDSTTNAVADDGVCTLREAITAANTDTSSGATAGECPAGTGSDTIELGVSLTYTLDVTDNSIDGPNGLPSIASVITINGNGSTIARDAPAPAFRIAHVGVGGNLTLNDVTITGGAVSSRDMGGGISNAGILAVTGSTVTGNSGSRGGGIRNIGQLTITNSTISGNSANGRGGGIYNEAAGTATITNSTLSGNTTGSNGGGIYNSGTVTITNSTISGHSNPALVGVGEGGGIYISSTGAAIIFNSTISENSAFRGGGIRAGGPVNLTNTIVANNLGGGGANGDCSGDFFITSLGNNLDSDNRCGLTHPTDLSGVNPLLGPLQDNGGPTETHSLLPGSPAIDGGGLIATVTDQRVVNRSYGADSDIGSFEAQGDCTLILDVSYTDGVATIEATVGTLVPATENIWGTFQSRMPNLESTAIPVTDPPTTTLVFSGAVHAQGLVGAFATLTTPELGIICSDFQTVDTGAP